MSSGRGLADVEVRGLVKDYGRQRVLGGIHLKLQAGESTVLLGDNGAGKSTLLGILATLIRPTRGVVLYGGAKQDEILEADLRSSLGVLGHEPRCYGDLSARENLLFFGKLYGLPEAALVPRIDTLLGRVNLSHAKDRPARTYSRGMLQRLALARTLLPEPAVLLLDEPYTGLDRAGVALLTDLLAEERNAGAMLLITSHDLEAVAPLCNQAVLLRKGKLVRTERFAPSTCTYKELIAVYQGGPS